MQSFFGVDFALELPICSRAPDLPYQCDFCPYSFSITRARRVHSLTYHSNEYMHLLLNSPERPYAGEPSSVEEKLLGRQQNVDYQSYWTKYFPLGVPPLINFPHGGHVQGPLFAPDNPRSFDPASNTVRENLAVEDVALKSVVFRQNRNFNGVSGGSNGKIRRSFDTSSLNISSGENRNSYSKRQQQHGGYASNVQKLVTKSKNTILKRNNCHNMNGNAKTVGFWSSENLSPNPGKRNKSSEVRRVAHRILRRQKFEPYHRLLSGCPIDRTDEILTFEAIGIEDLLCNLTCKSTKLVRQKSLFPVQDVHNEFMTDRSRFYYRPRRGFDPDYFGPDFGLEPLYKVPISPKQTTSRVSMSMSRYLRRADWYDRSLNRFQREWSHEIQNQLHMLNLMSLAGEHNGAGTADFGRHSEYLLKCYESRARKFMNNGYY
uniref:C2H2-type domain-containing protein n=1 Tax=Romanomermis culicivorax TaxID=13658 RepID=A0A915L7I3_ROMCU